MALKFGGRSSGAPFAASGPHFRAWCKCPHMHVRKLFAITSTEKRRSNVARTWARLIELILFTAPTASFTVWTTKPVTPCLTTSGTEPRRKPMMGLFPISWPEPFGLVMIEAMACGMTQSLTTGMISSFRSLARAQVRSTMAEISRNEDCRLVEGGERARAAPRGSAQSRACVLGGFITPSDRSIITADSGTSASWFARALKLRRGMMASLSGTLATMNCAIPYAIAAKFCFPDRLAIAFVGDGAMLMLSEAPRPRRH